MAVILYRESLMEKGELDIIKKYFPYVVDSMVGIDNQMVIGRYSCVPFYTEVERGLNLQGSHLINSPAQHRYIANFDYYEDIELYTPKTYFRLADVPRNGGPFVVKGKTNSKKHQWNKMMFAPTFHDAVRIGVELKNDYWFANQDVIVREYVKLKQYGEGTHGLPFTNEWRFFFYKNTMLSHGFYWSESEIQGQLDSAGIQLAIKIAAIVSEKTNFFVIDIGQKEDGSWIVIEINDGQMSGFSCNDPETLYCNLAKALNDETMEAREIERT
jgi:hypothetical protein